MADNDIRPRVSPSLNPPDSHSTVEVHIINTTTDIVVPAKAFVHPVQKGHEYMNMPTFAFLVKNKRLGKTIMFDLGCRKDWWNLSPAAHASIKNGIPGLRIAKSINDVLREGGEDDSKVDGVIWSHWHCHIGDISLFPSSTDLYVGPGFKEAFMPGYPSKKDSPMLESDFKGRTVHEVSFDSSKKIGQYPSFDLFGDGSFYILDVPGHAVGHVSGFARTTPDTFVFMGGDVCHFGGSFRPTPYAPMPTSIPASVPLDSSRFRMPCPCSIFTPSHRDPPNARTSTFYQVTQDPGGWYVNPLVAQQSVDKLEEFDADENVLVCVAHDGGLINVVEWFPKGPLNDWRQKGWKQRSQWGFLNELPIDGKPSRPWIAPGLVKEGKVVTGNDA